MIHGVQRSVRKLEQALLSCRDAQATQCIKEALHEIVSSEQHREEQEQEVMAALEAIEVGVEENINKAECAIHISENDNLPTCITDLEAENERLRMQLQEALAEVNMWKRRAVRAEDAVESLSREKTTVKQDLDAVTAGRKEDKIRFDKWGPCRSVHAAPLCLAGKLALGRACGP